MSTEIKLKRIIEIQAELDSRKALFEEYDRLVQDLAAEMFAQAEVQGLILSLKDNFAETNTVFRVAGVKRYEMTIEDKEKHEKRIAKQLKKQGA